MLFINKKKDNISLSLEQMLEIEKLFQRKNFEIEDKSFEIERLKNEIDKLNNQLSIKKDKDELLFNYENENFLLRKRNKILVKENNKLLTKIKKVENELSCIYDFFKDILKKLEITNLNNLTDNLISKIKKTNNSDNEKFENKSDKNINQEINIKLKKDSIEVEKILTKKIEEKNIFEKLDLIV